MGQNQHRGPNSTPSRPTTTQMTDHTAHHSATAVPHSLILRAHVSIAPAIVSCAHCCHLRVGSHGQSSFNLPSPNLPRGLPSRISLRLLGLPENPACAGHWGGDSLASLGYKIVPRHSLDPPSKEPKDFTGVLHHRIIVRCGQELLEPNLR